jgi:hypothetical protein
MSNGDDFLVKRWADGCVVFDRLRGDTHAFSAEAMSHCFDGDHVHLVPSRIRALIDGCSSVSSGALAEFAEVSPHDSLLTTVNPN